MNIETILNIIGSIGLFLVVAYIAVDFTNQENGKWGFDQEAKVCDSAWRHAHTTYHPVKIGKITTLQPRHHPDAWIIYATLRNGEEIEINVTKEEWEVCRENAHIIVQSLSGKWWGRELDWRIAQ